jgi:transcription-repair coupling factor (superfamily II helicase)
MSKSQPDIVKDSYLHCIDLLKKVTHQLPLLQQWSQSPHSISLPQIDTAPLAFIIAAIAHHLNAQKNKIILLIEDSHLLNSIHQELHTWHLPITLFSTSQTLPSTLTDPDSQAQQEHDLQQWILNQSPNTSTILLTSTESIFHNVLNPNSPHHFQYTLSENSFFDEELFIHQLHSFEYERRPTVVQRGQYSLRGGIIDLFPWHGLYPLRLEIFDNTLESIRQLDLHQQISIQKLNQISLDLRLHRDQTTSQPLHHFIQPQDWILSISPTKILSQHPQHIHFNSSISPPSLPHTGP